MRRKMLTCRNVPTYCRAVTEVDVFAALANTRTRSEAHARLRVTAGHDGAEVETLAAAVRGLADRGRLSFRIREVDPELWRTLHEALLLGVSPPDLLAFLDGRGFEVGALGQVGEVLARLYLKLWHEPLLAPLSAPPA